MLLFLASALSASGLANHAMQIAQLAKCKVFWHMFGGPHLRGSSAESAYSTWQLWTSLFLGQLILLPEIASTVMSRVMEASSAAAVVS